MAVSANTASIPSSITLLANIIKYAEGFLNLSLSSAQYASKIADAIPPSYLVNSPTACSSNSPAFNSPASIFSFKIRSQVACKATFCSPRSAVIFSLRLSTFFPPQDRSTLITRPSNLLWCNDRHLYWFSASTSVTNAWPRDLPVPFSVSNRT